MSNTLLRLRFKLLPFFLDCKVREARIARHLKSCDFLCSRGHGQWVVDMVQWAAAAGQRFCPHGDLDSCHSALVETWEIFGYLCSGGFCRHKKGQLEYHEGAVDG